MTLPDPVELRDERPWRERGRCRGQDPAIFFPERGDLEGVRRAKAICGLCPVLDACRSFAISEPATVGIFGATTDTERKRIRGNYVRSRARRVG